MAGDYQRLHDIPDSGGVYKYAGDLEDLNVLNCVDKSLLREFIVTGLAAIEQARQTKCSLLNLACRYRQRHTQLQEDKKAVADVALDCHGARQKTLDEP